MVGGNGAVGCPADRISECCNRLPGCTWYAPLASSAPADSALRRRRQFILKNAISSHGEMALRHHCGDWGICLRAVGSIPPLFTVVFSMPRKLLHGSVSSSLPVGGTPVQLKTKDHAAAKIERGVSANIWRDTAARPGRSLLQLFYEHLKPMERYRVFPRLCLESAWQRRRGGTS